MDDLVLFLSQSLHHELLVLEHSICFSDTAYQWPQPMPPSEGSLRGSLAKIKA
jgi:hypothetical protein